LRVSAFGDSTALLTGGGLDRWGQETTTLQVDISGTALGCGIVRGGRYRVPGYPEGPQREECNNWAQRWTKVLTERPAEVAVVLVGTWDVTDHQLPGESQWRAPGDPLYDAYLKKEMLAVVDELAAKSPVVVWLTCPLIDFGLSPNGISPHYAMSDPARMVRFNQLLGEVAAERPELHIVDLAGFLAGAPGGELDRTLRPDGVHFTDAAALQVANWLGPQLLALAGQPAG
jgi:lysophospholipase L1-like esterase